MARSVARYLEGKQRVYRFGIYGRSGAGKTCILAALNLVRTPNPDGYSCVRLSALPGVKPPGGAMESWRIEKDPVAAFYAGNHFLTNAEEALRRGELPPPNDQQPPYLMVYEFTIPGRGNVRVELLDYAGELTDARNINNNRLADLLRAHLRELDGIFVLAETPRPGEEDRHQPEELRRLQEAFALLQSTLRQGGRWNAPVALILGKWDRRGLPSSSAGMRYQETKQFLDQTPAPAVKQLCDMMRECATEGNFAVFAVSAFGPSRQESFSRPDGSQGSRDLPQMFSPLPSYGLENPFVWACQRRDQVDYAEYRAGLESKGLMRWLNPLRPDTPWRSAVKARRLGQQLPVGSERHREVARAWGSHLLAGLSRVVVLLWCVSLLWLGWEVFGVDRPTYRRVCTLLADRSASLEERGWAEDWLFRYGSSGPWRHVLSSMLVVSKGAALRQYEESIASREEDLWAQVEQHKQNLLAQADHAETYLKFYPENGQHTTEAWAILKRAAELREWHEVELALTRLEGRVGEGIASGNRKTHDFRQWQGELDKLKPPRLARAWPEELRQRRQKLYQTLSEQIVHLEGGSRREKENQNRAFLNRLENDVQLAKLPEDLNAPEQALREGFPYPEHLTEEIEKGKLGLQKQMASRRRELEDNQRWMKIESEYDDYMKDRNVGDAARVLVRAEEDSERWKAKRKDFRERAVKLLQDKSEEYRSQRTPDFDAAIKVLEDAQRDARILALLQDGETMQLAGYLGVAKTAKGKHLYEMLRAGKQIADAERYLKSNTDSRMAGVAQRYLEYLRAMDSEQEVTMKITRINWGDWFSGYVNRTSVFLGEEKLIATDVKSRKGGFSPDVGSRTFRAKINARVTLTVYLFYPGTFRLTTDKEPAGVRVYTGRLFDFREGKELELQDENDRPAMGASVTLKVEGIPQEPLLPPWKE